MKNEKVKRENGWDEITTRHIRFNGFKAKYFLQCRVWQENTTNRTKGAICCQFCGSRWEDKPKDEWTALVQSTHGNKVLCLDCFDDFGLENTGKSLEKRLEEQKS